VTKLIEVIVSPRGSLKLETKGFAGSDCQAASQGLERALGTAVLEQPTPEFFRSCAAPVQHQETRP
jgi:hypothetical protein